MIECLGFKAQGSWSAPIAASIPCLLTALEDIVRSTAINLFRGFGLGVAWEGAEYYLYCELGGNQTFNHPIIPPPMIKHISITLIFLGILNTGSAQALRFGLKAGAGLSNLDFSAPINPDYPDQVYYAEIWYERKAVFRPAFLVGGVLEYDLTKDFLMSAGLNLTSKFSHVRENSMANFTRDFKLNLLYVQLPVNIHYRISRFFIGAGGYVGLCAAGKWKLKETFISPNGTGEVFNSQGIALGNDSEFANLKPLDVGVRGELGYGFKTVRLSLAYDHGLTNNLPTLQDGMTYDGKLRHRAVYATVTYYWLVKD